MPKFTQSTLLSKRALGLICLMIGVGCFAITVRANTTTLLPDIPDLTTQGILGGGAGTRAGQNAIFVPPYSIGKVFLGTNWIYAINPGNTTGLIPSTNDGANWFNCNTMDLNHRGEQIGFTQQWRQTIKQIVTNQNQVAGTLSPWMEVSNEVNGGNTATGVSFWRGIMNNPTSFFNPAAVGNTAVSASSTISGQIINKINAAGGDTPGFIMACGCANPDVQPQVGDPTSFPPYWQQTFRSTQLATGAGCQQVTPTCIPTSGFFSDITSATGVTTGNRYRGSCNVPVITGCVLERFVRGVMSGTITYSKVRAATIPQSHIADTTSILPYAYNYLIGYGDYITGVYYGTYTGLHNHEGIVGEKAFLSAPITTAGTNDNQFALRGITPQTEGTNRGCLDDGTGYWITRNVYSSQLASYNNGVKTNLGNRPTAIDFADDVTTGGNTTIKLYGCQAELLPNPDAYCVEKLTKPASASVDTGYVYLKEFTEGAQDPFCNDISLKPTTGGNRSRGMLSPEDAGYNASASTAIPRNNKQLIYVTTPYFPMPLGVGTSLSQSIALNFGEPSQLINGNTGKILFQYLCKQGNNQWNLSGRIYPTTSLYGPSTYIFGIPKISQGILKDCIVYTQLGSPMYINPVNNSTTTGYISDVTFGTSSMASIKGIRIPLQNGYYIFEYQGNGPLSRYSIVKKDWTYWGLNSGNFAIKSVCYAANSNCTLPGGGTVLPGRTGTFYSASNAAAGTLCTAIAQTRQCVNGVLNGSNLYTNTSCSDNAPCPFGGSYGGSISVSDAGIGTAYSPLSYAGSEFTCRGGVCSSCTLGICSRLGSSLMFPNGRTGTFWDTAQPTRPGTCNAHAQVRQCINGALNGNSQYNYMGCTDPTYTPTGGGTNTNVGCMFDSECHAPTPYCDTTDPLHHFCRGGGNSNGGTSTNGCFLGDTQIRMADGSSKAIQSLIPGDIVDSPNATGARVELVDTIPYEGLVYSINQNPVFVTPTHPFLTTQGRKSLNPLKSAKEHPNMNISLLQIGDSILTKDGAITVYQLQSKKVHTNVYNISLSTGHTYYANGYQVHNSIYGAGGSSALLITDAASCNATPGCVRQYVYGGTTSAGSCYCSKITPFSNNAPPPVGGNKSQQHINTTQVILNGGATINRPLNVSYIDPGYTFSGGDGTVNIVDVAGIVNINAVGMYKILLTPVDSVDQGGVTSTRVVNVVDTIPPVLTLTTPTITRQVGSNFVDIPYTITDNYRSGGFTVVKTGYVDTGTPGNYTVLYIPVDPSGNIGMAQRGNINIVDTTPPVLTLKGAGTMRVQQNMSFTDPGVTVTDNYRTGTDIQVYSGGTVNTTIPGSYTLSYWAVDGSHNTGATVTRTVIVTSNVINFSQLTGTYYKDSNGLRYIQYLRYPNIPGLTTIINQTPVFQSTTTTTDGFYDLKGTFYIDNNGFYRWADYIINDKGSKRIIYKTPGFSNTYEVASYLRNTYGRGVGYPGFGTSFGYGYGSQSDLGLIDGNIYQEPVSIYRGEEFGYGYGQSIYTINGYGFGQETKTQEVINNPVFSTASDLLAYLKDSEGIIYSTPPLRKRPGDIGIVPATTEYLLSKDNNQYDIDTFNNGAIDTFNNGAKDEVGSNFNSAQEALDFINSQLGIQYLPPRTRYPLNNFMSAAGFPISELYKDLYGYQDLTGTFFVDSAGYTRRADYILDDKNQKRILYKTPGFHSIGEAANYMYGWYHRDLGYPGSRNQNQNKGYGYGNISDLQLVDDNIYQEPILNGDKTYSEITYMIPENYGYGQPGVSYGYGYGDAGAGEGGGKETRHAIAISPAFATPKDLQAYIKDSEGINYPTLPIDRTTDQLSISPNKSNIILSYGYGYGYDGQSYYGYGVGTGASAYNINFVNGMHPPIPVDAISSQINFPTIQEAQNFLNDRLIIGTSYLSPKTRYSWNQLTNTPRLNTTVAQNLAAGDTSTSTIDDSVNQISNYLSTTYKRNPSIPDIIPGPGDIQFSTSSHPGYKMIVKDLNGQYTQATYTRPDNGPSLLVGLSPSFSNVSDLYSFLTTYDGIQYDIGQNNYPNATDILGSYYSFLIVPCIESGHYTAAFYAPTNNLSLLVNTQRTLLRFGPSFDTPTQLLNYMSYYYDIDYPIPPNYADTDVRPAADKRYTIEDRGISRPTQAATLTLLGDNPMTMEVNTSFQEPGYDAQNASSVIVDTGSLHMDRVGTSQINYTPIGQGQGGGTAVTRTVKVVDTTPPVITLKGNNIVAQEVHKQYNDSGYTVSDNYTATGDITVTINGTVSFDTLGTYVLTYTATDKAGNSSSLTRTVKVVDTTPPVISIRGDTSTFSVPMGSQFTDPSFDISDNYSSEDNIIISRIIFAPDGSMVDSVNTSIAGDYTVYYAAQDENNNRSNLVSTTVTVSQSVVNHTVYSSFFDRDGSEKGFGEGYNGSNGEYGFLRYYVSGDQNILLNSTPFFDTIEEVQTYLMDTYTEGSDAKEIPPLSTLNIVAQPTSRDIILDTKDDTFKEVQYTTDSDGSRYLASLSQGFSDVDKLAEQILKTDHIAYQADPYPPTQQMLGIQTKSNIQDLSGMFYHDENRNLRRADFVSDGNGNNIIINKTPVFDDVEGGIVYLKNAYGRVVQKPEKEIPNQEGMQLIDGNVYKELIQNDDDTYSEVTYILDTKENKTAIAISPEFQDAAGLLSFLEDSEGIRYPEPTVRHTLSDLSITIPDNPGDGWGYGWLRQLSLDEGVYHITYFFLHGPDKIITNRMEFRRATDALDYLKKQEGLIYLPPLKWYSEAELNNMKSSIQDIAGAFFIDADGYTRRADYILDTDGNKEITYKTPAFNDVPGVINYLQQAYGRNVEDPKVTGIDPLSASNLRDGNSYQELVIDDNGNYSQVTYTIFNDTNFDYNKYGYGYDAKHESMGYNGGYLIATNQSPSFSNPQQLITFLRESEGIKYKMPAQRRTMHELGIVNPNDFAGAGFLYLQPFKTDAGYSAVSFAQDSEGGRHHLSVYTDPNTYETTFSTPQELLDSLESYYGRTFLPPRTRYTMEQLNIGD